jgi:hypothetical protein
VSVSIRSLKIESLLPEQCSLRHIKMKCASLIFVITILLFTQSTKAALAGTAFDGNWSVTIDFQQYKNPDGTMALAVTREFPVRVKNGVLHGETGKRGDANFYEINGTIEADGNATLHVNGITGSPQHTPFTLHNGVRFAYDVPSHFEGNHGTGHSVGDPAPHMLRVHASIPLLNIDGKSGHTDSHDRKWTIEGISINLIDSTAKD